MYSISKHHDCTHMKNKLITFVVVAVSTALSQGTTVVFDDSFAGFNDAALNGQGNWGSQAAFSVAGGFVTANNSGSFARAQRFAGFRPEVGDQVRITVSGFSISGNLGNGSDQFRIGIQALPENTGTVTPQVGANIALNAGNSLSIGGATDTGYDLGDNLTLLLTFTRTAADAWSLDSQITNLTDTTIFTGSTAPTNLTGSSTATPPVGTAGSNGITLGNYLLGDSNNQAQFGMRLLANSTSSTFSIGGVKLELIPVPEPSSSVLLLSALMLGLSRRSRR